MELVKLISSDSQKESPKPRGKVLQRNVSKPSPRSLRSRIGSGVQKVYLERIPRWPLPYDAP